MFGDFEVLKLLFQGHPLEWTGKTWRMLPSSALAAMHAPQAWVPAEAVPLVWAPPAGAPTPCSGSRMATLLKQPYVHALV
jgi:hypothetical protein